MVEREFRSDDVSARRLFLSAVLKAVRAICLPLSILTLLLGYYKLWSISGDWAFDEIVAATRCGVILVFLGALMLVASLYRMVR